MEMATTLQFADAARSLARSCQMLGLACPSFRSPPRLLGVDRSIQRRTSSVVVAIRLHTRPLAAVLADMIDGVVAANHLAGRAAEDARRHLWDAVGHQVPPLRVIVGGRAA
jgi:hypothetical protein